MVEQTPEERVRDRVLSNLFRPERSRACRSRIRVGGAEAKGQTTVSLRFPFRSAARQDSVGARGERRLLGLRRVRVRGRGFSDVVRQRQPFDVPRADAAQADGGHFTYELPVVVASERPASRSASGTRWGAEAGFLVVDVAGGKATLRR